MYYLTKKFIVFCISILILIGIQVGGVFYSQPNEVRIIDNSTGKTTFQIFSNNSKEFVEALILANNNFTKDNNSEFGITPSNSRFQIKRINTVFLNRDEVSYLLPVTCNLELGYFDNYNVNIINKIRDRGS